VAMVDRSLYGAFAIVLFWCTDAAPRTDQNSPWNVNFQRKHIPEEYFGSWDGHEYFPSPKNWRSIAIYQLLTDRFADGDPRNNEIYEGDFDVRDMTFRHGGDFVGLRQKLPYIKGLGCTAIWISPVFRNGPNSYHQYAMHDFTLIDPRLGTLEELRDLTTAAHELGIYVIIDVVMNHMDNAFAFEGHEQGSAPFKMHEDEEYRLVLRHPERELFATPAGKQPYMDFWYNNTWDPDATYGGPVYGKWGQAAVDEGKGTYPYSDFHHNGDLIDYTNPWQITLGKIYGMMDDLRLESRRVQDKYIAMTKALISSVDVDGFRVDTPMQVPLEFFKSWAPAVREHARSLGKESFGLFGEFFVTTERFATMTGRGKTPSMYGRDAFIDGTATLKGGIDYSYYWYFFTTLVLDRPEFTDGLPLVYHHEGSMLDTVDPTTGKPEYAMWTFCNNHDNWRLQTLSGSKQLRLCLAIISFWPGIPVHYAGDEQELDTPGNALSGWAREELSVSMAWRSLRTAPSGNPATADNFDMTSAPYRYLQRLNALRAAYLGDFESEQCDELDVRETNHSEVLVFLRGCSDDGLVAVAANFHATEARNVSFSTPWPQGTALSDVLTSELLDSQVSIGAGGVASLALSPLEVRVFVPGPVKSLPPAVAAVSPAHGAIITQLSVPGSRLNVTVQFDQPVDGAQAEASVRFDGQYGQGFLCSDPSDDGGCYQLTLSVDVASLGDGVHSIEVDQGVDATGDSALSTAVAFSSTFVVAAAEESGVLANLAIHEQPGLVCNYLTQLCHKAAGAEWYRVQHMGGPWTEWRRYEEVSSWQAEFGRAVLVQYHAQGSSSYIVGDCVLPEGARCYARYHPEMFLRTEDNDWGMKDEGRMALVDHFTWAVNMSFNRFVEAKFAPFPNWSKSYGVMPSRDVYFGLPSYDKRDFWMSPTHDGTEAVRQYMLNNGFWSEQVSIASGSGAAEPLWLSHLCKPDPPSPSDRVDEGWQCHYFSGSQDRDWCQLVGEDEDYIYTPNNGTTFMGECGSCDCCRKPRHTNGANRSAVKHTCCILFNDLFLNYTVTSDASKCQAVQIVPAPPDPQPGSLWISLGMGIVWTILPCAVAMRGVVQKKSKSVILMRLAPEELQVSSGKAAPCLANQVTQPCSSISCAPTCNAPPMTARTESCTEHGVNIFKPHRVLFASLEHVIEHEGGREKAIAGGLGKVAGLMCRYHPGSLICVTACMPDKDYSFASYVGQVRAVVSGQALCCDVLRYEAFGQAFDNSVDEEAPPDVTYYIIDHPIFRERDDIYPAPQTRRRTLEFYSLWCQAVARLIEQTQPDAYHCPDFHAAMAVMYIEEPLPVIVVLHNAEYQGAISTQNMGKHEAKHFGDIFNLPPERIIQETFIEGKFCMLKPVVDFAREHQEGYGICAVSRNYALEASQKHSVLWGLPEVRGIENCMPESERLVAIDSADEDAYAKSRAVAKRFIQEKFGLTQDPDARLFVFLGRWVKQKGVDYIADVTEWMLKTYKNAQLVMIGPVGDSYGSYARAKFDRLKSSGRFEGNLFVHAGFLEVPKELKLACDFCLMPSRDEPFGYVDIEFAWFGAAIVGSLRGGLGKLPGFYFQILNADSSEHMQTALRKSISAAMKAKPETLAAMSASARASTFPVTGWQREVMGIYQLTLSKFYSQASVVPEPRTPRGPFSARGSISARSQRGSQLSDDRHGCLPAGDEFLHQEASEAEMQALVDAKLASCNPRCAADIIEEVEWERELSQEKGCLTRALGRMVFGAPILDWIICMSYISGPLVAALASGHAHLGQEHAASVERPCAEAVALLAWTLAACIAPPNLLMAAALLARLMPLALPFFDAPAWFVALALGVVGPSDYLFLYYSFMGSSVGDVARLAIRTGFIMAVREQWEPLLVLLTRSPRAVELSLIVQFALLLAILPALSMLQAPKLYKVFRVPGLSLSWMRKLRFLMFFGVAAVLEAFAHTSSAAVLTLRRMQPFDLEWAQAYCFFLAVATAGPMLLLARVLRRFPSYAVVAVKAFACWSLPSTVLQCWAQAEVDRARYLVHELDALIFTSTVVGALAVYAGAVAVLATVGSRWRFVSYACVVGILSHLARAASFMMVDSIFGEGVLEGDISHAFAAQFARRLLIIALPACGSALLFRLLAFAYFEQEATGMLNTQMNRDLVRLAGIGKAPMVSARSTEIDDGSISEASAPRLEMDSAAAPRTTPHLEGPMLLGGKAPRASTSLKRGDDGTPRQQHDLASLPQSEDAQERDGAAAAAAIAVAPHLNFAVAQAKPSVMDRLLRKQRHPGS